MSRDLRIRGNDYAGRSHHEPGGWLVSNVIQLAGRNPLRPVARLHGPECKKTTMHNSTVVIPLNDGRETLIDAIDLDLVSSRKWRWIRSKSATGVGYVISYDGYDNGIRKPDIRLHRLLIEVKAGEDVDHINRNSLDNRRCNLRVATRSQNIANCSYPSRPNQTGFRGVKPEPRRDGYAYRAVLCVNYKRIRGRVRYSAEEAAADYDLLAIAHFGEFATLNFPQEIA